jgi:hypothetical protein
MIENLPSGKRIWELTKEAIRIEAQAYSQEITMEEVYNRILSRDCERFASGLSRNEKRFFETVLDVQCLHRLRDQDGLQVRSATSKGEFRIAALSACHELGPGEAVKLARATVPGIQRERISRIQAGLVRMAALRRECELGCAREQKELHRAELESPNIWIERMADLAGDATVDRDAIADIIRTERADLAIWLERTKASDREIVMER